jgi:hypothetical protein
VIHIILTKNAFFSPENQHALPSKQANPSPIQKGGTYVIILTKKCHFLARKSGKQIFKAHLQR